MTKIKLCGLTRPCDMQAANDLMPDFVGFVFAPKSKRFVTPEKAAALKAALNPAITAVGVFVNALPEKIAALYRQGVIDMAQLHGGEDAAYIARLRALADVPLIQAFCVRSEREVCAANASTADYVLLDAGAGTGTVFDWRCLNAAERPYFLAGGLDCANVKAAVRNLSPYAVDVSSGIETDGVKDVGKMRAFVSAVRSIPGLTAAAEKSKIQQK